MGLITSLKTAFSKPYRPRATGQACPSGSAEGQYRGRPEDPAVIAVCAAGVRSAAAARILADRGYNAYSLRSGMAAWRQAGEPVR